MKKLRVNRMAFSPFIWGLIAPQGIREQILNTPEDGLVEQAAYRTGTISALDAGELRAIVEAFEPKVVAEVGTYIGRSTRAMAMGMRDGLIYTCDASNDIKLPAMYGATVEQFPMTSSTDMFRALVERGVRVDMFYIDGRLAPEDVGLMQKLSATPLVVLDDFEGIEKGVANAMLLGNAFGQTHFLIYPRDSGKTALYLPASALEFASQ